MSTCILGFPTRYDGRSKECKISGIEEYEKIHFCPEKILGIPRESIELVKLDNGEVRVMGTKTRIDVTDTIKERCLNKIKELKEIEDSIACFVLKSKSPSCGTASKLFDYAGTQIGNHNGLWNNLIKENFPSIPCFTEEQQDEILAYLKTCE